MDTVEQTLANWQSQLVQCIPLGGLHSRNPVVYKWKAPFRSWMLREAVIWRTVDLLTQSYALHQQNSTLGARILLRSAFESLATLIYLNQISQQVLDGQIRFNEFGKKTSVLLVGSRDGGTDVKSLNIVTVLQKCDKRYDFLSKLYAELSESAHPSFEGLCMGYSKVDHDEDVTNFSNRWTELYGAKHLGEMELCMYILEHEYNTVWPNLMTMLEKWIEENDAELEVAKKADDEKAT